jgi:CelD/BcsL family acetyltransferase involved in cellulose biosynthesis
MPILPWRDTLTVRALEGADALQFLAVHWPVLYAQDPDATPFQSSTWLRGWAAQHADARPVVLVAAHAPGRHVAALALAREFNDQGRSRISPLGSPAAEYVRAVGPGASRPHVAAALVQRLAEWAGDGVVVVPDVPATTPLGRMLAVEPGWRQSTVMCAQVPLPVSYEGMSRSTRRDHVRRERVWTAFEGEGRVAYVRSRTVDELAAGASDALYLHRRRWARHPARVTGELSGLLEVLRRCGPGEAFAATLRLNDAPVAGMVMLYRAQTCYSLLSAMDPAIRDLAPGRALHRRLTADLARHGFNVLDLGRTRSDPGQVSYKNSLGAVWTTTVTAASPGAW